MIRAVLASLLLAAVAAGSARADITQHHTLVMKVGESRRIGTFGAHRADCATSIPGDIQVVQPPHQGAISQQAGIPYTLHRSVNGSCVGTSFVGTAVEYTARMAGSEEFAFDVIYQDGRDHQFVTIRITP